MKETQLKIECEAEELLLSIKCKLVSIQIRRDEKSPEKRLGSLEISIALQIFTRVVHFSYCTLNKDSQIFQPSSNYMTMRHQFMVFRD